MFHFHSLLFSKCYPRTKSATLQIFYAKGSPIGLHIKKITADWAVPHCEFCQFPAQHLQTISSQVRSVRIWQLKKMFIILVITSTLLENSRFHVLKYIKASINPNVFTNLPFFQENSTLLPLSQASWFLIECQYLLTLIF